METVIHSPGLLGKGAGCGDKTTIIITNPIPEDVTCFLCLAILANRIKAQLAKLAHS